MYKLCIVWVEVVGMVGGFYTRCLFFRKRCGEAGLLRTLYKDFLLLVSHSENLYLPLSKRFLHSFHTPYNSNNYIYK